MTARPPRPRSPRRGVTLLEMLVAVALLVLMMTVIVQVFAAATGAVSAAKTFQELDGTLRHLDSTIRTDLQNVTARLTPPLDPAKNLGYLEYGENSFADIQGEDGDDYLRFTVKAPEGQLFTGRLYLSPTAGLTTTTMTAHQKNDYFTSQPVTISSQYAEVIYFLRNGNLYRRVLLVAPQYQNAVNAAFGAVSASGTFFTSAFGGASISVSWQGVNDLSARPIATGSMLLSASDPILVLNTLGDLTNRENRFAYQRFANDFFIDSAAGGTPGAAGNDGIPDDQNQDTVPDFYPSLYLNAVSYQHAGATFPLVNANAYWAHGTNPYSSQTVDTMAFPYIFPVAYSASDPTTTTGYGLQHTPDPSLDQTTLAGLKGLNHAPVDIGDSLPVPGSTQTWWGFPTWRETMSPNWNDPYYPVHVNSAQPNGLSTLSPISLPPMTGAYPAGWNGPIRQSPQLFNDGAGSLTFAAVPAAVSKVPDILWRQVWEDDLIATGVRSFDVKAYDNSFPGYVDLGWGDDLRITGAATAGYLSSTPTSTTWAGGTFDTYLQTYAHEGRMPPLYNDNRLDAQNPVVAGSTMNVGDDTAGIVRLRRVWDTWSTDYSNAPATGVNSNPKDAMGNPNPNYGMPMGPPFGPPIYPSYAPPYPMPLRGIQIQIRVVDPRGERIKVLTIRQDFSDKL